MALDDAVQEWVRGETDDNTLVTEYVVMAVSTDMATGDVFTSLTHRDGMLSHHVHGLIRSAEARYCALAADKDDDE